MKENESNQLWEKLWVIRGWVKNLWCITSKTYKVFFSKMTGFYLYEVDDFEIKEEKVYGNHEPKLNKVFNSYDKFDRSLGSSGK